MTHPWVMGKNCLKYHSNTSYQWKIMSKTQILAMYALWPWPLSYGIWSKSRHTLRSLTTIVWNIIQIQQGSKTFWPGHRVWLCVHGDLDLGYMTFGQGHYTPLGSWTTPVWNIQMQWGSKKLWSDTDFGYVMTLGQGHDIQLGHGQHLCKILLKSNMAVKSHGPDTDFGYVCTVT